jgi:hypothetical protein
MTGVFGLYILDGLQTHLHGSSSKSVYTAPFGKEHSV